MATEKIDLNNLDKSDWKTYRFDEIAQNISERVDPNNTDLEVYIGLEHIDSESLHIKRHGTPDDVNGTKLKFYKDDIIFGRRRAYQRKAGIATCDGFCSAHALVLRANPEIIDPALFPFFMHSDLFMNRAVDISVGSLSPTINWGTLKHQKFLIPPLKLHKKLSELLSNLNVIKEVNIDLNDRLQTIYEAFVKEKCLNNKGSFIKLSEIIDRLDSGISVNSEEGEITADDKGILKTSAVSYGFFDPNEYKKVRADEITRLKGKVEKNTIIISRMNTYELVGANAYVEGIHDNLYLPDRLWQTHISREDINVKFLWLILSSKKYRANISMLSSGTSNSMKNISKESFLSLKVCVPDKPYQDKIVSQVEQIERSKFDLSTKLEHSIKLQKSIINQVF